jgi:hypothetical protein
MPPPPWHAVLLPCRAAAMSPCRAVPPPPCHAMLPLLCHRHAAAAAAAMLPCRAICHAMPPLLCHRHAVPGHGSPWCPTLWHGVCKVWGRAVPWHARMPRHAAAVPPCRATAVPCRAMVLHAAQCRGMVSAKFGAVPFHGVPACQDTAPPCHAVACRGMRRRAMSWQAGPWFSMLPDAVARCLQSLGPCRSAACPHAKIRRRAAAAAVARRAAERHVVAGRAMVRHGALCRGTVSAKFGAVLFRSVPACQDTAPPCRAVPCRAAERHIMAGRAMALHAAA